MSTKGETSIPDVVDWILESGCSNNGISFHPSKQLRNDSLLSRTNSSSNDRSCCYGGPLSLLALDKLSFLCNSGSGLNGWMDVDVDSLMTLMEYLRDHVESAASVDLFCEAMESSLSNGENSKKAALEKKHGADFYTSVLNSGLEAAAILVSILAAPNLDPKLLSDEIIVSFVTLLKRHMTKHIIPALSPIELILNSTTATNIVPQDVDDKTTAEAAAKEKTPKARKRPISKISGTGSVSKKVASSSTLRVSEICKGIVSSLDVFITLMDKIDCLCQKINVEDQFLFIIIQCCFSSYTLDPFCASCIAANQASIVIRGLQQSSTTILTTLFQLHNRHREMILQDILPLILKLPSSKKSLRLFQVTCNFNRNGQIQVITALILRLIQSCILMPNGELYVKEMIDKSDKTKEDQLQSSSMVMNNKNQGLDECRKMTELIVSELILRCIRKTDEGVEFRVFLSNVIQDLLLLTPSLEFPSAETILYTLCRRLLEITVQSSLTHGSNAKGSSSIDGGFLMSSLDILGSVCAELACKRLYLRKHPIQLPRSVSEMTFGLHPTESDLLKRDSSLKDFTLTSENCQCYCERKFVDTFMIDCDRCHKWFHGSCARVPRDKPLKVWFCDDCLLYDRLFQEAKSLVTVSKKMTDIQLSPRDHIQIMRLSLLKEISESFTSSEVFDSHTAENASKFHDISTQRNFHQARWYLLATWIEENELKNRISSDNRDDAFEPSVVTRRILCNWYIQSSDQGLNHRLGFLPPMKRDSLLLSLFCRSSSLASFSSQILGFLIAVLDDPSPTLRKGGVKSLAQVVDVDLSLMNQREMREAVIKLFSDEAISVREAAITLAGSYITQVPNLCNVFHIVLLDRLKNDVGISVRKRVVKILKDVILCDYNYKGRSVACVALIERMIDPKEDDSVRDLIYQTFQTLWFDPRISCSSQTSAIARQMVNVMKISEPSNHLVLLVKEFQSPKLIKSGAGKKDISVPTSTVTAENVITISSHLSSISSALIEMLLIAVEQPMNRDAGTLSGEDLVAIIRTVNVFAEGAPSTLIKHIDTLLPFLRGVCRFHGEYESLVVMHICKILSSILQAVSCIETATLVNGSLIEDLSIIVDRFGSGTVGASIELMTRLSEICDNHGDANKHEQELIRISEKFYSYLFRMKERIDRFITSTEADTATSRNNDIKHTQCFESLLSPNILSNIHRSLAGLGYICRYHKSVSALPTTNELSIDISVTSELQWANLLTTSYAIFEYFAQNADIKTRCHALRAITGVCIAEPRLLIHAEQRGLFTSILSAESETKLLTEALRCWEDMLISEEHRLENGDAKREMDQRELSLSDKISGDQDGDASLIGSCCTQHAHALFELSVHVSSVVRYQSLSLIDVLLRQGLMNPMEAVPYLFSLQGDFDAKIQQYSLKLLLREGDRRPETLKQRLFTGLTSAFYLQRKLYNQSKPSSLLGVPNRQQKICICTEIFQRYILTSRSQSHKLLSSLLEPFKRSSQMSVPLRSLVPDEFLKENSERFLMLCFISEIVAHFPYNYLSDILLVIKLALSQITLDGFELAHAYEEILRPAGADSDFKDAKEKSKMGKKLYALLTKNTVNINDFFELCRSATSVIVLLKLKSFLCDVYSISESRLHEFQDGGKESTADKVINQPKDMSIFRNDIPKLYKEDGVTLNIESLVLIYIEFKELFRHHS